MWNSARIRLFVAILFVLSALVALIWILSARRRDETLVAVTSHENHRTLPSVIEPTPAIPSPTPTTQPSAEPTPQTSITQPESSPGPSPGSQPSPAAPTTSLLIPVAGVRPEQLRDTFTEARSEGRTHDAIDILAPRGTPVLAAADGRIIKLFQSVPGGTTIYQLDPDNRTIYYYAHLDRYADGLTEGHFAHRGEVIAYVGDTGNAGAGNYHLHFSISIVSDPKRYWEGTNINPYPLLRGKP
ncbi:MAG TPA: peptidoglycan DD-metalloendopeptidase family protein [Pyrinomonadaceae bacterium]|nr:peptidoglycan DD-metalloendopeptidase family protein [Pyrinomonadaceae bacterium]